MREAIELTIEATDGIIDCRLEPVENDDELSYSATILYPNIVNGFSRSEIYCHNLYRDDKTGNYHFEDGTDILPKIKQLEAQIGKAIVAASKK